MRSRSVRCCIVFVCLSAIMLYPMPIRAVETAGELFVDLDAGTFTTGDTTWINAGTYVDFGAVEGPGGGPIGGSIEGTPAVFFDGTQAFVGGSLDAPEEAPEGLTGLDPTRSIEVWALNPIIASEETLVSWGKRGGPDGSNMSFNYGNHGNFGAVGHWGGGGPDLGWIDDAFTPGAPERNKWHHLVYTYDEEIARVYSDGDLWYEEDMVQWGGLDTHFDTAIAIASQWESDGLTLEPNLKGNLAIGRVRIHDEVLTDAQIKSNYDEEKPDFHDPGVVVVNPEPIPELPIHRYSFSNPASGDATDATITDSIGGMDGVIVGEGSSFTGTELRLDGGDMNLAAYVDLPNGLISKLTDATLEGWMTLEAAQTWQRVFDFGSTDGGELDEPGGGGNGQDQWMLSAARGGDINLQRFSMKNADPEFGGDSEGTLSDAEQLLDTSIPTDFDEEFHFAAVYDSDGGVAGTPIMRLYRDGQLEGEMGVTIELGNLNDVNNWLGRSNWTADQNTAGLYNEFRIFDYALTDGQILGNFQEGPDVLNVVSGMEGDYNDDGVIDALDMDLQAAEMKKPLAEQDLDKFDHNDDGMINVGDAGPDESGWGDRLILIRTLRGTSVGDTNMDGVFDSGDLVLALQGAKYAVDAGNAEMASWIEGDWNGDMIFDSGDLVFAFQDGQYVAAAAPAVPEPSGIALALLGLALMSLRRRRS